MSAHPNLLLIQLICWNSK